MSNTAKTNRKNNLKLLVEQVGTQKKFADICNLAPAHVSQMKNGKRSMGDEVARRIERELKLTIGWMDASDHEKSDKQKIDREALIYAKLLSKLSALDKKEIFSEIDKMITKNRIKENLS